MAKETAPREAHPGTEWEYDVAYKLVDLYVRELIERRDRKMLNIEGLVEAYLYVLGRLKASEHEIGEIVKAVRGGMRQKPEAAEESGIKEALGEKNKKISAGLLRALENM